ncbi:MAG: 2-hydroxyacyl-CoA dehydratase [Desulfobacterales bacterium]|nr:2-hydroxyacyl-CoA dehydratase [Desulfobacterales bacterium]
MNRKSGGRIGYTCAYTPLPLIAAAGFTPYRILPMGDIPDQAGQFLHDNLCPHVKKVLDRVLAGDMPELAGTILVNSCDAMRRLADAWRTARPNDNLLLVDLPVTTDEPAIKFFAAQIEEMAARLKQWGGINFNEGAIEKSLDDFNTLSGKLESLADDAYRGNLAGGRTGLQRLYNDCTQSDFAESISRCTTLIEGAPMAIAGGVPVFLFGNVLPDPEAFEMFVECGAQVVGDDFCTGYRQFTSLADGRPGESVSLRLARKTLTKPPCARTFFPAQPGRLAHDTLAAAKACGAAGVIGHTVKFCDPYLARMPIFREEFKVAGMPLLLLEGDCTLRSMGQQRTRIEAFIEMLR